MTALSPSLPAHPIILSPSKDEAPPARPAAATGPKRLPRHNEWTRAKMVAFLRELAASRSVARAARAVAMSRQSAYKLRRRLAGAPFALAWAMALEPPFARGAAAPPGEGDTGDAAGRGSGAVACVASVALGARERRNSAGAAG